jgi:predicted RNA binding protein YcfA (HicA-like mRNA interferase family)
MKGAEMIKEFKATGWVPDRSRGPRHVFRHPARPAIVVVPHPKTDPGTGLVAAIRKQAGP